MRVQRRKSSFQLEEFTEASLRQKYEGQGRLRRREEHRVLVESSWILASEVQAAVRK